jgi:hypothetical protein
MTSPVICQYKHDLGSCMMTSPVIWQYRDSTWVAGWWLLLTCVSIETDPATRSCLYTVIWQEKTSSSYPYTVSMLTYDWRSHHPATQILSLYWHMTGEVIIQLPRYCLYTVIWLGKWSSRHRDSIWVAGWWLLLSYDSIETWSGFKLLVNVLSVLPSVTDSNYPCGVFKRLVNVLSVLPSVTDSNYPCGVFKRLVNVLSVLPSVTDSNYPCGIFKRLVNVLSVLPSVTDSNYPCGVFKRLVNVLSVLSSVTDSQTTHLPKVWRYNRGN